MARVISGILASTCISMTTSARWSTEKTSSPVPSLHCYTVCAAATYSNPSPRWNQKRTLRSNRPSGGSASPSVCSAYRSSHECSSWRPVLQSSRTSIKLRSFERPRRSYLLCRFLFHPIATSTHCLSQYSKKPAVPNKQLCYVTGLLLGNLERGSLHYVLFWPSHRSRRPVRLIGTAKILAADEAIDEGKIIATSLSAALGTSVFLHIVLDSKYLYTSLFTMRNNDEKSIRDHDNFIRY